MMTLPKLRRFALPLLALLATSGAVRAQPFLAAPTGPLLHQKLTTELALPVVEKPRQGNEGAWFSFGDDDDDGARRGHDDEDEDNGDDDDEGGHGGQVNCALTHGEGAQRDCKARLGQSATPPANGLFTPGTAPQAKSN